MIVSRGDRIDRTRNKSPELVFAAALAFGTFSSGINGLFRESLACRSPAIAYEVITRCQSLP